MYHTNLSTEIWIMTKRWEGRQLGVSFNLHSVFFCFFYFVLSLFPPSPRFCCCTKSVPVVPFLFSSNGKLQSSFLKFMCMDQRAVWPLFCRAKIVVQTHRSNPGHTTCCIGRIMRRFLADAVSTPEAILPSMCLSKHEHCEQRDPRSLQSALRDCGHEGIWVNTAWDVFKWDASLCCCSTLRVPWGDCKTHCLLPVYCMHFWEMELILIVTDIL